MAERAIVEIVLDGIAQLIVTIAAVYIGARLAMGYGKRSTRWNAKYSAHHSILNAIADIQHWAAETSADQLMLPSVGQPALEEARQAYQSAKRVLWSFVRTGDLLVSEAVRRKLDDMLGELHREEYRYEEEYGDPKDNWQLLAGHAQEIEKIIEKHRPAIVEAAKADLR